MAWRTGAFLLLMLALLAPVAPAAGGDAPPFDWRGFYLGYHLGGALGLADVRDPFGHFDLRRYRAHAGALGRRPGRL